MAGLAATAAVAPFFDEVLLVDRDRLPDTPQARMGVPQGKFASNLLLGGQRALEELLPGFTEHLALSGATPVRLGLDVRQELPGYLPFPRRELGLDGFAMSRPHLEHVVRGCVQELTNVRVESHCTADPIPSTATNAQSQRVTLRSQAGGGWTVQADLVIDSTGRANPTLQLLEALGLPLPQERRIGIQAKFTTVLYRLHDSRPDWKIFLSRPAVPGNLRSGVAFLLEGGATMLVSVISRNGDIHPATVEAFEGFTRTLGSDTLRRLIDSAERLSEPARFAFPQSLRRDFKHYPDWPTGWIPLGDGVCRINPSYGQGMTVGALQARLLRRLLREDVDLATLPARFFARLGDVIDDAWSAGETDFLYPGTTGTRPANFEDRMRRHRAVLRCAAQDAEMHRLMLKVQHLARPGSDLWDAAALEAVERHL